jgi:hydroxymethylpyrimidine/phosphomethylpyrimidine kinase
MKKILLSVAGFDPTSGAGVSLDLKVFQSLGYYGMAVLTSLTAQNTQTVEKIRCDPAKHVWEQYRVLRDEVEFSGIKVGMLGCRQNIPIISKILDANPGIPKIIDPVFRSSSGVWLLEKDSVPDYLKTIKEKASLITPNRDEAGWILGTGVRGVSDIEKAAKHITDLAGFPCLIKGGHIEGQRIDILYDGKKIHRFKNTMLKKKVHGTGCFLSSSILCYLAKELSLEAACELAIKTTRQAIKKAKSVGRGQDLFIFPIDL